MATVEAFNNMMNEFLSQMRRTGTKLGISDPGAMKDAQRALFLCQRSPDPKKRQFVLDKFAKYTVPYYTLVKASHPDGSFDEATFKEFLNTAKESPLMKAVKVHVFWDDLPDASKKGIWQFLNHLLEMAVEIKARVQ